MSDTIVCAFIVDGMTSYFGELYFDPEDKEKNKLIFKRALIRIFEANKESPSAKWIKVPTAGKESLVQIDTRTTRGILVKDIDEDILSEYKEASRRLYSKLHLA